MQSLHSWRSYWHSEAGPRQVLGLALPLVLSSCSLTLQVFIDRLFLAWYSQAAIAAAIPAVCVLWVLVAPLHGIVSFANTFVAQYHGAGRSARIGPVVGQAVLVALFGGTAMLALVPCSRTVFNFVGHEPAVRDLEAIYFQTLLVSAAPMLVMTAASSFFGGLGRTWVVFVINLAVTVVNVVLDYGLIFGRWGMPELGIAGAGWATAIAYLVAAVLSLVFLWLADEDGRYGVRGSPGNEARRVGRVCETHQSSSLLSTEAGNGGSRGLDPPYVLDRTGVVDPLPAPSNPREFWKLDAELMGRLFRFGGPNGLMIMIDVLGWTWFELLVGRLGTAALAATNVTFNINMLAILPMLGLSTATQILVGQRLGENRPDLAARSTWSAFWLAFVYTVVLGASYVLTPELFIAPFQWYTSSPVTAEGPETQTSLASTLAHRDLVVVLLRFVALYTLFDMAAMIFSGALRGAGDTRFVMMFTLAAAVGVLAVPSYLACGHWSGGVHTAWCFVTAYVLVLGAAFFLRFRSGVWRSMRVIEPALSASPSLSA